MLWTMQDDQALALQNKGFICKWNTVYIYVTIFVKNISD